MKTDSASKTAARFGVSLSTVHRLRRLDRLRGFVEPKPHAGGHARRITDDDRFGPATGWKVHGT